MQTIEIAGHLVAEGVDHDSVGLVCTITAVIDCPCSIGFAGDWFMMKSAIRRDFDRSDAITFDQRFTRNFGRFNLIYMSTFPRDQKLQKSPEKMGAFHRYRPEPPYLQTNDTDVGGSRVEPMPLTRFLALL